MTRGDRLLGGTASAPAGRPAPLSFGSWIGGDMDGNPAAGATTIRRRSTARRSSRWRAIATEVRALAVALAMHRSLVSVSPELDESIARDERELPDYAAEIGARTSSSRTGGSSPSCGGGSATTATTTPTELLADLDVLGGSLEANRGARIAAAASPRCADGRALRLPCREARRPAARARAARATRGREALAAAAEARRRHGPARARHASSSQARSRPATCSPCSTLSDEPLSVVPLFETIRDLGRRAGDPRELLAEPRFARRRGRGAGRGHGRLLRLRQGRRLPRRAVGDLPGAGGARRGRPRGTTSS